MKPEESGDDDLLPCPWVCPECFGVIDLNRAASVVFQNYRPYCRRCLRIAMQSVYPYFTHLL